MPLVDSRETVLDDILPAIDMSRRGDHVQSRRLLDSDVSLTIEINPNRCNNAQRAPRHHLRRRSGGRAQPHLLRVEYRYAEQESRGRVHADREE